MAKTGASGTSGASADAVSQLVKVLAEEQGFTSVEIAETLWLAMQMEPALQVAPEPPPPLAPSLPPPPIASDDRDEPELPPPPPLPPPAPKVNIAAPTPQAGVLPPQVLPVWLADPAMLTDALAIIRALRPLLQKVAAGIGKRLDEPATVEAIARTRLCLPVLEAEQEPWFDIILVVDRGSSMHIWQRLVKDVVRILRRYGAFRDVQVFDLVVQSDPSTDGSVHGGSVHGGSVQLMTKPGRSGHRPSELIDQQGRRIVIVLSDCAGAYWWDGTLLPMLKDWGKIMPTVVWQMLPSWMWKRTALGRGTAVAICNDVPGGANQRLQARVQERDEPADAGQRIVMPVVTSEVRDLARWSLMVAGDRRQVTPGFLLPQQGGAVPRSKTIEEIARDRVSVAEQSRMQQTSDESEDIDSNAAFEVAFNEAIETIARERVDRFLDLASPQAQRLIMLLAAAPVITLPVVRLICDAMLYEASSPLPVAEVFLSGLVLRLPGQEDQVLEQALQHERDTVELDDLPRASESEPEPMLRDRQDLVQYDFAPKVRKMLLDVLPAVDAIEVINSVSAAVERRWNRVSTADFRAFLTNPNVAVPEGLEGLRSFASVTADILEQLGGDYAGFAQQLRQGADGRAPLPEPVQEENIFPELEPFEFIDAQLEDDSTSTFPPPLQTEEFTVITFQETIEPFEFTVARLIRQRTAGQTEWVIGRHEQQAYRFVERLSEDIALEMMSIPGGTFTMGSPDNEPQRQSPEGPQHRVTVPPFLMGRYPITQAQWRAVAELSQVARELDPDPSRFKGNNRPVERVSWRDAIEFCARLSAFTGRDYRLPTEAEWEYACRANTTTAFHFGEMLTTEVANYNGSAYANGPKGRSRKETTPVDHFGIANVFGLSDMHGNVYEWCQDHWHDDYKGAPADGSAWLTDNDSAGRVRRGGSWNYDPRYCRSAFRYFNFPDDRFNAFGLRVCCSAPVT